MTPCPCPVIRCAVTPAGKPDSRRRAAVRERRRDAARPGLVARAAPGTQHTGDGVGVGGECGVVDRRRGRMSAGGG
jgi:hypothetical protein